MATESKKSKTESNYDIWLSSDSESESESKTSTETVERSAKTRLRRKTMQNVESARTSKKSDSSLQTTPKASPRNVSKNKSAEITFKIKLRRSTDQSMYKIQRETPESPVKRNTPRRTRSNSSDISSTSTPTSRTGNYSKGEIEAILESPDQESTSTSSQRSTRSRRPPLKLASYDYSPLPSSNNYENSPKSTSRLRTRQRINYNEANLELMGASIDTTPRRARKETVSTPRGRGTPVASKKGITAAATISTPNLRNRNLKNIRLSEKEADSDTDSSSVSSSSTRRTRLTLSKALAANLESTNDNKENMPSTSKRMDVTPSKVTRSRTISTRQNEDTSNPIIDLTLPISSRTSKRVASKNIRGGSPLSSAVDSDSTTISRESYKEMRAEYELRTKIIEDSIECRTNKIPPKKIVIGRKAINSDESEEDISNSTFSLDSLKTMKAERNLRAKILEDTTESSTNKIPRGKGKIPSKNGKIPSNKIVIGRKPIDSDASEDDSDSSTVSSESLKALKEAAELRAKILERTAENSANKIPRGKGKIPPKNGKIASNKIVIGRKPIDLDASEDDSDSSTISSESLKALKEAAELRAKILEGTVESSTDKITSRKGKNTPQKKNVSLKTDNILTPDPGGNKKYNTRKRATSMKAGENRDNLEIEIVNVNTSSSDAVSDEEPLKKVKNSLKSAQKKREVARAVEASPKQASEEHSVNQDSVAKSPKSLSAVRYKCLTPSIGKRTSAALKPATPLQNARARLHVGAVPKSLPCREEEFNTIFSYLKGKLLDKTGGCIYICGVPGTGKTATVNEVVRCLEKLVREGELEDFNFVAINALKLTEPRQAYVQILKKLRGQTYMWSQAQKILENRFKTHCSKTTILLVDEFDHICVGNQQVVYNILTWPTEKRANLVVVTIANRMDLPEKVLMSRVASRLGYTRLTFQPYTHQQLLEIVVGRLKDLNSFRSEAIQLIARKVSAVSGDARRALDICRRAVEITESRDASTISLDDVTQAIYEMIASPKVRAIQSCSELEKLFLLAVTAEIERTSVEEVIFSDAYVQMQSLCSFEGVPRTNVSETLAICDRLAASRILICTNVSIDIQQKILLNVSTDDIYYAIKQSQD